MRKAPVYVEVGAKRAFASAAGWPGWSRSGKTEEAALETLSAYAIRRIAWHALDHAWEMEDRIP